MECPLRLLSDWRAMGRRRPFTTNLLMEPALQSSLVAGCLACVAPRHFLMPVSPKQILPVGCLPSWGQVVLSPNERTSSFPENRVVPPVSPVSTPSRCGDRSEWPFLLAKPHSRGRGSSASHRATERPAGTGRAGGASRLQPPFKCCCYTTVMNSGMSLVIYSVTVSLHK